jgi:hypothetical protein
MLRNGDAVAESAGGRDGDSKCFVFKILTPKPLGFEILQAPFCKPRAQRGI